MARNSRSPLSCNEALPPDSTASFNGSPRTRSHADRSDPERFQRRSQRKRGEIMNNPALGWTIERFLSSQFKVFCVHANGSVQSFTVMSVVREKDGPDELTIRIEPPSPPTVSDG